MTTDMTNVGARQRSFCESLVDDGWEWPGGDDPRTGRRDHLGCCFRCGTSWSFVAHHDTPYDPVYACFPLCENCWGDLTPRERLPYYARLLRLWKVSYENDLATEDELARRRGLHEAIGAAVMAGL